MKPSINANDDRTESNFSESDAPEEKKLKP
jgi:H+/Cl- antiporter ClcA